EAASVIGDRGPAAREFRAAQRHDGSPYRLRLRVGFDNDTGDDGGAGLVWRDRAAIALRLLRQDRRRGDTGEDDREPAQRILDRRRLTDCVSPHCRLTRVATPAARSRNFGSCQEVMSERSTATK